MSFFSKIVKAAEIVVFGPDPFVEVNDDDDNCYLTSAEALEIIADELKKHLEKNK